MKTKNIGFGLLIGLLLTLPLTTLSYLGNQWVGLPYIPFSIFDWMTRVLPGDVITFGIDLMIDTMRFLNISVADAAKTAERVSAVLQFIGIGAVTGAIFMVVLSARKMRPAGIIGTVIGILFGGPIIAITLAISESPFDPPVIILWLTTLFIAWGILLVVASHTLHADPEMVEETPLASAQALNRRQFLVRFGASMATITLLSGGVGAGFAQAERRRREAEAQAYIAETLGTTAVPLPNASDPLIPALGTRPEYTPIPDHYQVFLRTEPTTIEEADWSLPIEGLVDNPVTLTLDDIRNNYPAREQYVTLTCISGRVGTGLISTTKWTGVSAQDLLADLGVQDNAGYLFISSGDGFYETISLDMIRQDERIMFAYDWDDRPIPKDHGFPLRIWIPDLYGMKQPKWITKIEVVEDKIPGYWVERNWDDVAQIQTTSVIDTVAVDSAYETQGQLFVPVGGIAFSGDRGISQVEVRVDGGDWQPAELRAPLSETTWVVWRYEWPFSEGDHTFEVRTAEADGTAQHEEDRTNRPSGARGLHSFDV